jgi:hypothetical protein
MYAVWYLKNIILMIYDGNLEYKGITSKEQLLFDIVGSRFEMNQDESR